MPDRIYPSQPESVYFYGTCLVDLFYPDAGMAGIELLKREGLQVIFPQDQSCCGQPAYNSGYREEARAVVRSQLALFSKPIPIIVPSGSCASMMRNRFPDLFEGDPDESKAVALSGRVFELTEFLVHVLEVDLVDLGPPVNVTWHGSCSMQREMGLREEPRQLLQQLNQVQLTPLERERECCGFGGTFSVKLPEISSAMAKDKADDVRRTGAQILISGDCGCMMNIKGTLEQDGAPVTAKHIAQFLWERTHESG
ncbi:MAG: (Fe-S)-binding protein [Gammaproteobacteria bacterium]|nr:(Fe-S)-binding protein [Gammaproteobacteria bacterium]